MSLTLMREFRQLRRQQWVPEYELESIQLEKLQRQVKRAWDYSSFYQERFKSVGFEPGDLKSLSDLQKLPIITKAELVAAGESVACQDINPANCVHLSTSGSSGRPISLPFTHYDKSHRVLKELRALMANGYRLADKMAIMVAPSDIVKKALPLQKLGLLRRYYMSVFAGEAELITNLNSMRPDVIYSYTSTLRILAEKVLSGECRIHKPKILISAAEVLEPTARESLTTAFGVEPVDFYGSMEFGWMAWQCPQRHGYHINADCIIMESLQDGSPVEPGEEGELVVTNLHSDAAPLIRYAIGDTGVISTKRCECGRTLPLIACIGGRLADCITLPSGRQLTPYKVTCAVESIPGIQQFQVIQETQSSIRVRLLRNMKMPDAHMVQTAVEQALGEPARVVVEHASALERERNGKFKVVKSLVSSGITTTGETACSSLYEEALK